MRSAETVGQIIAIGLFIIFPLVLIILNGLSLRRHRTNKMCALAAIALLLSIIVLMLAGMGAETTHVPEKLLASLSFTGLGLQLCSFIFAIIGLVQVLLKRRYVRGRWRAIICLIF